MMPVFLACKNVADVHLNGWCRYSLQSVVYGNAGVAVTAGIDDDAVVFESHLLYMVYYFALDIALEMADFNVRKFALELSDVFIHRGVAIHFWFTFPCEVEVRSVDNCDFFHR